MTQFELYTFILCLIVFLLLSTLFSVLLWLLVKLVICLIRHGAEDEAILKELSSGEQTKKQTSIWDVCGVLLSAVVCLALILSFAFSVYMQATEDQAPNGVPSLKVVKSSSMSYANEKNGYLAKNKITNQLQTFDLIVTQKLPDEFDLKMYDVVVYQQRDTLVIHRIVGIEEPTALHPDCRHFKLQGDAVQYPDSYPVLYSQMQGIWNGARVPFVGSFILFMQSPAGWLCILLILLGMISVPLVEKKIEKEKRLRLQAIRHVVPLIQKPVREYISREQYYARMSTSKAKKNKYAYKLLPVESLALSHFHLSLKVQKESPHVDLKIEKNHHLLRKKDLNLRRHR